MVEEPFPWSPPHSSYPSSHNRALGWERRRGGADAVSVELSSIYTNSHEYHYIRISVLTDPQKCFLPKKSLLKHVLGFPKKGLF